MEAAANFDMQSLALVHAIFWLREKLMRAAPSTPRKPQGLLAETQSMGWGLLVEQPGHLIVCGASCQPWLANSGFTPIPVDCFALYAEPNRVKIAWTLEADSLGPATTHFAHETRAVATDAQARVHFTTIFNQAAYQDGLGEAMRRVIDDFALHYPGIRTVEHVYLYAVNMADEATLRGYLDRAYLLGKNVTGA